MKQFIALVFVSFCPFLSGLIYPTLFGAYLNWNNSTIAYVFMVQSIIWFVFFALWFDGSKYQRSL